MKINKTQWLITLALSGALISGCQQAVTKPAVNLNDTAAAAINNAVIHKSPNDDRTYAALLLPNHLQVVLISDPTLESSAASLAVGVGSAQDPEGQPGLAHYLEHMLFLGTKKYPTPDNFMEFVEQNAGMTNAFTAYDKTNFLFKINAAKFDEALDRYSDYFKAPLLDPQYADKERHAVDSEWSMDKSQDPWILQELDGLTANPANPHYHFMIGNLETLQDKKDSKLQDELKAFYNRYYSANNMRLTLVGKQSIAELKALAEKHFADIPNKNVVRPKVTVPGLTAAEMGKSIHYVPRQDIKQILVDFPVKDNKDQWALKPNEFVLNLLGSEEEGTLCEQLRKEGLASRVSAQIEPDEYGADGYLRVAIELTDDGLKNPDKIIASVFSYVDLVKQQGLNDRYFRELKAMREKDFANIPKPDPLKQAIAITTNQFDLPVEHLLDADFVFDHYDAQAITAVLNQLQPQNARVWYIDKNEKADKTIPHFDGEYSIRDITTDERARWTALGQQMHFKLPPENNLFTDKPADIVDNVYTKPHQVVSEKGIEVYLQQPQFYREDKGVLDVELNVPFALSSAKNIVLSNLLSDIFKLQETTLIDRAERASLQLNMSTGATGSQFINIAGYTTKHEELLREVLASFVNLQVTDQEFSDALVRYKQDRQNAKKAIPIRQAFGHTRRLIGKAQWTDEELLAAAAKITRQDLLAYHKAIESNLLIRIYAFGNYSEDGIKQIAEVAKQQLPGNRLPAQRAIPQYITPQQGKILGFNDKVEQADSALVDLYLDNKKSVDERAQLSVLNALLGNAFFSQLRTNEQLGYVVGSSPVSPGDEYPGFALYVQSTNTDLVGIKKRIDKFRKEFMAQLQAVDAAQIEQIKAAEAANIQQKPTDFYKEAKRIDADFWNARFNFDSRERYLAALAKVDKASLLAVYQRLLADGKAMHILVQLQGTNFKDKPFAPLTH